MAVKSEETLGNSKKYNRRRPILSVCQIAECLVWSSQSLGRGSRSRAVDLGHITGWERQNQISVLGCNSPSMK